MRNIISKQIIALKEADLLLRDKLVREGELSKGYNSKMKALHNSNADALDSIIDEIGYPTVEKVGREASDAAWLVIQHAISKPAFMRKCLALLEHAIAQNEADPLHLAYLSDRISINEGKPQLYGTQFDWDESGQLSPQRYDDRNKVNERRRFVGLNTLEEQTEIIRQQALTDNLSPPDDLEVRKKEIEEWRKKVGWK